MFHGALSKWLQIDQLACIYFSKWSIIVHHLSISSVIFVMEIEIRNFLKWGREYKNKHVNTAQTTLSIFYQSQHYKNGKEIQLRNLFFLSFSSIRSDNNKLNFLIFFFAVVCHIQSNSQQENLKSRPFAVGVVKYILIVEGRRSRGGKFSLNFNFKINFSISTPF